MYLDPISIEGTEKIIEQMKHSICKIITNDGRIATGFFCKIPYKKLFLPVLITNNHVIDESYIFKNNSVVITFNDDRKKKKLTFDYYRKIYSNKEHNITIIEIKEEDNKELEFVNFTEIDENLLKDHCEMIYMKKSIYIPNYPKGDRAMVSYGIISNIDKYDLKYKLCYLGPGSSGAPILNINNNRVIGIHEGASKNFNYYKGTLLKCAINEFTKDINIIRKYKEYKDEDFTNLKLISFESFGKIYSAYHIEYKEELCLKKIDIENMKLNYEQNKLNDYRKDLDNEIKILEILSYDKSCVKYYGNYEKNNEKIIIMEKCENNLKEFIKERGKGLSTQEIKKKILILNNLFKNIQDHQIIHRDLKLENFLIKYINEEKTDYIIKLGDYGIGKFKRKLFPNSIFSGLKGTIETVAPEIILEKKHSYENSVDIFSLGIVLYQIANNLKHPYEENFTKLIIKYNNNYENDNLEIEFDVEIKDNEFKDLVKKMIKLNPKNRISWEKYFDHPFFK